MSCARACLERKRPPRILDTDSSAVHELHLAVAEGQRPRVERQEFSARSALRQESMRYSGWCAIWGRYVAEL